MSKSVLIYVQHLLGIGHLQRAGLIARALDAAGAQVTLVSGGMPWPGLALGRARLVQLAGLRARNGDFRDLIDAAGRPLDDALRAGRRDRLLAILAETRPDLVITETWPFGRRALGFELAPFMAAIRARRPRPILVASIRDILVTRNDPARDAEIVNTINNYFDYVMVHADPVLVRLEASFAAAPAIADRLIYTGYVAPDPMPPGPDLPRGEIIVSAGGGAAGLPLLTAAIAARKLSRYADAPWRLIGGGNLPTTDLAGLHDHLPAGMIIESHRRDFPALLGQARLSISQAGYNTCLDLLRARVPGVLVPFVAPGETEQVQRAGLLAARGLVELADPNPASLAAAIDRARMPPPIALDLDGARRSAALLLDMIG